MRAWYSSAGVGRPMPLLEQEAIGLKRSYATGPLCQRVWLHAQTALGVLYANRHPVRALKYTMAAAKAGLTAAMNNLAVMVAGRNPFFLTHQMPPSQSAHHWLLGAATHGDATAQHNLACYWKNRGLFAARAHRFPLANACYKKAIAWYLLSIQHASITKHQRGYARLLRPVRYNVLRGRRITRRHFARPRSATRLMLTFNKQYVVPVPAAVASLRWYCTHCPTPAAAARYNLAVLYSQRREIAPYVHAAALWLKRAAAGGYRTAEYQLGAAYASNAATPWIPFTWAGKAPPRATWPRAGFLGITGNPSKGRVLLEKAAAQGSKRAKRELAASP